MLVLSRRVNEKILFPSINAAIQVVSIKGGVVRLGVEAPPDVTVLREEIARLTSSPTAPMPTPRPSAPDEPSLRKLMGQLRDRLHMSPASASARCSCFWTPTVRKTPRKCCPNSATTSSFCVAAWKASWTKHRPNGRHQHARPARHCWSRMTAISASCWRAFCRMAGLEVDTAGDGPDALDYLPRSLVPMWFSWTWGCRAATARRRFAVSAAILPMLDCAFTR